MGVLSVLIAVGVILSRGQGTNSVEERADDSSAANASYVAGAESLQEAVCPRIGNLIDVYTQAQFETSLGSCALVGSGGLLAGRGMGGIINGHDTVIRVNRLPSSAYYPDLGSKTDLLFSNSATDTYPAGQTGLWVTKMKESQPVGEKLYCAYKPYTASHCPFGSVIVARSTKYGTDRVGERHRMPFTISPQLQPPFPIAHPSLPLETFYWNAAPLQGHYTSGGLKAFFAVAPMCDSITLYGFGGSGNMDGHTVDSVHDFNAEHEWLHRLALGDIRNEDFSAVGADKWLKQNGLDYSVFESLQSFIDTLKDSLQCMANQGKIQIDGWSPPTEAELSQDWEVADSGADAEGRSAADSPVPRGAHPPAGYSVLLLGVPGLLLVAAISLAVVFRSRPASGAGSLAIASSESEGGTRPLFRSCPAASAASLAIAGGESEGQACC